MKTVVVASGYFNPLHAGHLRYLVAARELGDSLIVIVNNDRQQMLKKHRIIMGEEERIEIVRALRDVDEAVLSIDEDRSVRRTLENIATQHAGTTVVFANGGDRDSRTDIPETEVCERLGIELRFGVGGAEKVNSSSNITRLLGVDDGMDASRCRGGVTAGGQEAHGNPTDSTAWRKSMLRCAAPMPGNPCVAFTEEHRLGRIRLPSGSRVLDWEGSEWRAYVKEGARWYLDELTDEDFDMLWECLSAQLRELLG